MDAETGVNIENFKKTLDDNGQSRMWFYKKFIKDKCCLTYPGFIHQLNGVSNTVSPFVSGAITEYMDKQETVNRG
jgi:hypothetical protein